MNYFIIPNALEGIMRDGLEVCLAELLTRSGTTGPHLSRGGFVVCIRELEGESYRRLKYAHFMVYKMQNIMLL